MNSETLLEVDNLKISFQAHKVLDGVSFKVRRGEVVAVIGKSGSGKTVLLKSLAGLLKAGEGQIKLNLKNEHAIPVGFAFQKSPLFPWLTISENINLCVNREVEKTYADELLKKVGLENFKNHLPQQISGGMAQKVNLLRALSNNCDLILMDEPFGSLDSFQRAELQQFTYETCRSLDRSLILVTHDIDEALLLSDRILILSARSGKFTKQIDVNIERPQKIIEMRLQPNYNRLFQQILQALADAEALV